MRIQSLTICPEKFRTTSQKTEMGQTFSEEKYQPDKQQTVKKFNEEGQSIIEFAFAISLVFLLTFGLADLGRLVYTVSVVRAAAQEGARTGIVDISEISSAIQEKLVGLDGERAQIDVSQPDENSVAVAITYEYQFMVPLIAMAVGQDGVTLKSSASMIIR